MRAVWPGFKFRVGLCGDEPGMIRNLNHLDDPSVRGDAGQLHTVFRQGLAVIVVDLIAVAVTFVDRFLSVFCPIYGSLLQPWPRLLCVLSCYGITLRMVTGCL